MGEGKYRKKEVLARALVLLGVVVPSNKHRGSWEL